MIRAGALLLASTLLLGPASAVAEPIDWPRALAQARGEAYLRLRAQVAALSAAERSALRAEALSAASAAFEAAGLALAATEDESTRAACRRLVYDLRGLDAERLAQRRRKDPEAASHLRAAMRNGCEPFVLELALRPELYELEGARSLAPEQRAALERGQVIALGGAHTAPARGYLEALARDPALSPALGRRALEAYGQAAGPAATLRLRAVAEAAGRPVEHRAGALVGLGFTGDPAARAPLAALLRHSEPALASAALAGLSTLASPANERATDALRREVSRELVSLLVDSEGVAGDRVLDALAYVAHPSALDELAARRGIRGSVRLDAADRRLRRALARAGHSTSELAPSRPETPAVSSPSPAPR